MVFKRKVKLYHRQYAKNKHQLQQEVYCKHLATAIFIKSFWMAAREGCTPEVKIIRLREFKNRPNASLVRVDFKEKNSAKVIFLSKAFNDKNQLAGMWCDAAKNRSCRFEEIINKHKIITIYKSEDIEC